MERVLLGACFEVTARSFPDVSAVPLDGIQSDRVRVPLSWAGPEEPVPVLVLHSRCGFQFLDGWVDPVSHWDPVEGRVGLDPPIVRLVCPA